MRGPGFAFRPVAGSRADCQSQGHMSPVTYTGLRRADGGATVHKQVDDLAPTELPMRNDIRNHSPDGAEWGYGGSGPAQLSLALLADVLGDEAAQDLYQRFKRAVVAGFSREGFTITADAIEAWAKTLETEPGA